MGTSVRRVQTARKVHMTTRQMIVGVWILLLCLGKIIIWERVSRVAMMAWQLNSRSLRSTLPVWSSLMKQPQLLQMEQKVKPVRFMAMKSKFMPSTLRWMYVYLLRLKFSQIWPQKENDQAKKQIHPMICMSKSCQSSITTRFYYYYKSIKIKSHPYIQRRKDFLLGFIHPIRLFDYKVRGSGLNPVYSFISASMRSVSIVYKKGQRDSCCQLIPQSSSPSPLNQPSRSVDNYYDRLFVKHEQRQRTLSLKKETLERNKLKSANNLRKGDAFHIVDTLNIASLSIKEPHPRSMQPFKQETKTQAKFILTKKLSVGRPVLAGLNLIPIDQLYEEESSQGHHSQAKLKCLHKYKDKEVKGTVLAISANFILDETYFWQEQEIEDSAVRHWKMLQNYSNIAWICRKEDTMKKIAKFTKINNLRLDAVYLIVPKKNKKLLTVGYTPIENDFGIKYSHSPLPSREDKKLVIVNGLLVEDIQNVTFDSFYHSIPVIRNGRSVIHYTKIDLNDSGRFGTVVKILSQSVTPKPFCLSSLLRDFQISEEESEIEDCSCEMRAFSPTKNNLLQRLQIFKKQCVQFFERSMSLKLHQKVSCELRQTSGQYMIGDTIRRNYKIFKNYEHFSHEYEVHVHHQQIHEDKLKKKKQKFGSSPIRYRNVAYLWDL